MGRASEQETRLLQILNTNGNNNKCGECGAAYPTWASWNLGIFLCGRCASVHRGLGPDVSQVKSLSLDKWANYELNCLDSIGNRENQRFWNNKKVPFPYDEDDKDSVTTYLRDKYIYGKFTTYEVTQEDYRLNDRERSRSSRPRSHSTTSRSRSKGGSSRSRSSYGSSSRLTYRSISSSERAKYGDAARKLKYDIGYDDLDLNIEALVITHGDVNAAAELLSREPPSSGSNKRNDDSNPPPLPRRKPTSGSLLDPTKTGSANVDWLSDSLPSSATSQPTGAAGAAGSAGNVQIYQYIDPTTGSVYYVDQNGQQYIDPQQQQLLLQQQQQAMIQQQQQLQFQAQKTGIMSLYNQNQNQNQNSVSNPQVTGAAPSLNDIALQQQQQQQMMMMQQQQYLQQQQQQQQPGYFNGF